ncbi:MAG: DUF1573 domain-containing protein [Muribaculum sp.]|nr:DUF1573 domain-containing protein [Muribaculum sp.]
MKHLSLRTIFILAILLYMPTVSAQIKWLSTVHDFGAFAEEIGPVTTEFRFVNESSRPVSILHAQASCGCTKPTYTTRPVQPGDTASVSVTYNPMGRPGRFDKSVKVKTDASPETFRLTVEGVVIGSPKTLTTNYPVQCGLFSLKNTIVNFGDITAGHVKNKFVEGYNLSSDSISPILTGLPPYIDADIAPKVVGPGVQFIISFFFNASRAADIYGLTENPVYVSLNDNNPPCRLSLIANVSEDFYKLTPSQLAEAPNIAISTSSVDLGQGKRGEKASAEVTINNFGKNPLLIRKIQISDDDKTLSIIPSKTKIKKGSSSKVNVTVDTSLLPADTDIINSKAIIITNDPQHPITPLRIVGEIK